MTNIYQRINQINPQVNAIVNLLPEKEAIELARHADNVPLSERGILHGLPMAMKDSVAIKGFATTLGFQPYAERIETQDSPLAERMRKAGVIFIGHTNMPEFGLGSNTFNSVFGATHNPYDLSKTAGGSSGGAAAALATDMLPLADGSDMGGSLRNPASFCNVVGFRPSIGRTQKNLGAAWYGRLVTTGPMAKTVQDTALLMSVMSGSDISDPLNLSDSDEDFLEALTPYKINKNKPLKVAVSPCLGELPIDGQVVDIIHAAGDTFKNLGAEITYADPPLEGAMEAFQIQRAVGLRGLGKMLDQSVDNWRQYAKETVIWNIKKGQSLSIDEMIKAEMIRTNIYAKMASFFEEYDVLLLPSAQVPPFDLSKEWVEEIEGTKLDTYIDWMSVCCMITVTGLPAISVPGGFTKEGLPVGVQLVGKPRGDIGLLKIAHLFESKTNFYKMKPSGFK
jgi:amidase